MWYAKPSGYYGYGSTEGRANIEMMNGYFNSQNYTLECQAGIMGNVVAESGLNPWRWQGDTYSRGGGYGLFQYTPAYSDSQGNIGYIDTCQDIDGYGPNLSTIYVTAGARPEDGWAQCVAFSTNRLAKWVSWCWRDYWDRNTYPSLWNTRQRVLNTYGDGSSLTMAQFKTITDVYDATFAFLACFEGPRYPNMDDRWLNASAIYQMLTGVTPPEPPGPGPGPTPGASSKFKLMFYLKPKWKKGF